MKCDRDIDYDDYIEDEPELVEGICSECGEICKVITIDEGIGDYEYWGARGTHHDYVQVSDCCHATAEEL